MQHIDIPLIKERVDIKALNKLNLAGALWAGLADLSNYPKKPTKPF